MVGVLLKGSTSAGSVVCCFPGTVVSLQCPTTGLASFHYRTLPLPYKLGSDIDGLV